MSILAEFWGPLACFTRPEMKVERISYEVPTASAARGMIESVYFHPGLRWRIDGTMVCEAGSAHWDALNPLCGMSTLTSVGAPGERQAEPAPTCYRLSNR